MNRYKFVLTGLNLALLLGLAQSSTAQTAKYNNAGDLIWITKLLDDFTGCEAPKVFTGKIVKVESFNGDKAVGYEFSLRLTTGKTQRLQASISLEDGAVLVDFENLMQKNRRLKVKARQCGSGGYRTAEEITRM